MSSVITSLLSSTFGLLLTKARDYTAEKLKGGDLTDEQFRKLIVGELDDIKSKLDGLARKDLLSSISFFKEGVNRLYLSIDTNSSSDAETEQENIQQANKATMMGDGLTCLVGILSGLKITSKERFRTAKESFKSARDRATDAFSNEALSTEDRILAIKLRMASTILESLEDLDAAANDCLLYLQDLHAMSAVQEIFSVYLDGGILQTLLNKTQRFEMVKSVTMVNFALFGFTKAFTKAPVDLFNWPKIEIGTRSYHPLCDQETKILREMKLGVTCELKTNGIVSSAVNSKGEIILERNVNGNFNVINSQGEIKLFCSLPQEDTEAGLCSLAIDDEDNVYVGRSFKQTDGDYIFKLFVFDAEGNLKHQFAPQYLSMRTKEWFPIAVDMVKNIIIINDSWARCVLIYNSAGQVQESFSIAQLGDIVHLSMTDKNEIIAAPLSGNTVDIYTEDGERKQEIKLPEDHDVQGVAFNHITKKVIVYTKMRYSHTLQLLSYSKAGELQNTLPLPPDASARYSKLTSHPSGPVALVHKKGVLFI